MAADQRKKRLNASSIGGHSSRVQFKAKRKKLELPRYEFNTRCNISLEWDDKKKSVVAKREQIGIAQRDLIQFIGAVPHCHNILADVFSVPWGTFELENLTEVLSYEVWKTHLSEKERKLLTQFLPKGAEAHEVVKELLSGDNFHFGNPFLKWGASLCSGNLHPDAVLHQEQCFKATKMTYYSELQNYHNDMIGNLKMWKERWASCKDPEREIVQKIWRSSVHAEKSMPTHASGSKLRDPDENLVVTSDSCSWAADEKACSSDNLNLMMMHGESQRRICKKDFTEGNYDNSSDGLKVVSRPRKGENIHRRNIQFGDGAKYMSYIKVSKEQHQRVKSSMKHSSNGIQPRSLNHVLGNLDTLHVQPYELFEEEEQQKLYEHWLQLANRDLPAGFANWRRRQLEKLQMIVSLGQEMQGKLKSLKEDELKGSPCSMLPEQANNGASDPGPTNTIEDEDNLRSDSLLQEQMDGGTTNHEPAIALEDEDKLRSDSLLQEQIDGGTTNHEPAIALADEDEEDPGIFQEQADNGAANYELTMEDENVSVPASSQNQHPEQISLLNGIHEFRPVDLGSGDNRIIAETNDFPPSVSEHSEKLNHVNVHVSQGDPLSSTGDVWPVVSMESAYYHSTSISHKYTSASELSLGHPEVMEEVRVIDLESDMREEGAEKDLFHIQSNDESFFSPYPNQDRHELLQSFYKGHEGFPYHHEQKQTRLDFQPANVMETGQFPGHFREQLHTSMQLELRQKRLNDLYMHQNIQENVYSDVGRYFPRQEHFPPLNIQDWGVNTIHMSAPPQSHLNGGDSLSQTWFSGEHRARVGWSGSEGAVVPNQSIGSGSSANQSLFRVLSQCNELRSGASYESMGSTDPFIQSESYVGMGGGVPTTSNVLPRTANPLNYMSGHEAAAGLKTNSRGWVSVPHRNTALQDSMGKPFLSSWNQ